ncbi:integral membrane regulator [Agromyces rhizosphaerae]|uniref:Integral membrane regulator n=1 Tax=Agromyces rhizosphaerae TaxID=88374 RepID=A0A9W6CZZ4_9MICO|nr:Pr6Pr family membrane protein [Agromyces rhizosphaerae]GLI28374.1 integral membrane regulator [Agromyces rhizosphaerae]
MSASPWRVLGAPSFWWRVAIALVILAGILSGSHKLQFFTSNASVFALAYYAIAVVLMVQRRTTDAPAPRLRGGIVVWLLTTMLVSHFINNHGENPLPGLVDAADASELLSNWSAFLVHYVAPIMVLAEFVLFRPHGRTRWVDIALWLLFPLGYAAASITRAVLLPVVPDRYPYPFLDPEGRGYGDVVVGVLQIGVGIAVIGALVVAVDRLLGRWSRSRSDASAESGIDDPQTHQPAT